MNSLSHVAIAVNDISAAKKLFEELAGESATKPKFVKDQKVDASFIDLQGVHLEILQPTDENSPISKFLQTKGGGLHHICIQTATFDQTVERIKSLGIRTLGEPSVGAKDRRVIFFHPKDTYGVLIELEEK